MKVLILIATFWSISLHAQYYNWQILENDSHSATTAEEIATLVEQFPMILANSDLKVEDLDFVNVNESTFKYIGETTCDEDDARLFHESITYFACPKKDPTKCIVKVGEILSSKDPCLE